jgi:hypothetical protein
MIIQKQQNQFVYFDCTYNPPPPKSSFVDKKFSIEERILDTDAGKQLS